MKRGFTIIELMMGISITAMVMAALGAVCMATANGWRQGEFTRSAWISGSGAASQVQRALRDAKYIGYIVPGDLTATPAVPASVFYWRADDFDGDADGVLQIGEMGLIEFDTTERSLIRYEAKAWSASLSPSELLQLGGDPQYHLQRSDLVNNASAGAQFKTYLTNTGLGVVTPIARNISAAQFTGIRTDEVTPTGRSVVQFQLRVERLNDATVPGGQGGASIERSSVTLRAPTTRPTNF